VFISDTDILVSHLTLLVTEERYWALFYMPLSTCIHVFTQFAGCTSKSVNTPVVIYFTNKILNSISMGIFLLVLPSRLTLHIILIHSPQCSSVKSSTPNIKWAMWEMQQNYWDYDLTKSNGCAPVSSVSSWWWPWRWDDISFFFPQLILRDLQHIYTASWLANLWYYCHIWLRSMATHGLSQSS
jgi:hypothetical protein